MFKLPFLRGKDDVKTEIILLLMIGGLYSLGIFLSNTFVNVYLWRQSGEFITIATYNLAVFIFQPITFILSGNLAKKVDRIVVLRIGVIFLSLFFITVLIIGEKAAVYNVILGSLLGIGYGFYWLAYNVLTFEITEPETRDLFNGFLGTLESFGGMLGPIIAGFIISKMESTQGYTTIFVISLLLFVLAVICSFFLKRRRADGKFNLRKIYDERKLNNNWRNVLYAHTFEGFYDGVFGFVIIIWVFVITNSEFILGVFNFVLFGLSFIFFIIVTKFLKPANRKKAIFVGGAVIYFTLYIILFKLNHISLFVYAILVGVSTPIIGVPYASMTYDVIGLSRYAKENRIEFIVLRELYINIGRVISIVFFILGILLIDSKLIIPYLLATFGMGYLFIPYFMYKIRVE